MSQRTIARVVVQELTKYGFKDEAGYVSWSKDISDTDKSLVVPGARFDAEYYVSDKGTRYLNKIVARSAKVEAPPVAASPAPAVDTERAKKFTPKFAKKNDSATSAGLSKEEWADKDRRISRQGCVQAAVQALAPVVSLETLMEESVKLADKMLEFVNRK